MTTYAAMRKAPNATPVPRRPLRPAATRAIPVLDVHHPLERDAHATVARAFDVPRPTSTSSGDSPIAVDPHELKRAPGVALSPSTRGLFEDRMGRSFSGVRVHVGTEAHSLAERLHARAFTHGRDIYFARGEFRPETRGGRGLIAHELAHTLQPQARGGSPAIARFAAPGAAPPVISEEAKTWLDAWRCVEPTSPQALALLAAFQRLPEAVQAELLMHFKVDTAATRARLAEAIEYRAAMSRQRVIGRDGLGGTITGTQKFVEDMQWVNQTSRGTAAVVSNLLGAEGLGIGMRLFDDKERQLATGELFAGVGNILLTGPGINQVLDSPPPQRTIELKIPFGSSVLSALQSPTQPKLTPPTPAGPKSAFDDSRVIAGSISATAPKTDPNAALVKKFEAARAHDGVERLPSATDREIMTLARESLRADKKTLVDAAKQGLRLPFRADAFLNDHLTAHTKDVITRRYGAARARGVESGVIGFIGGRRVYGSAKHGVGVVKYGDTWFVVQLKDASAQVPTRATLVEILGKFE